MKNDLSSKIKNYLNFRQSRKNKTKEKLSIKNIINKDDKLKKFYSETNILSNSNINMPIDYTNDLNNITLNDKNRLKNSYLMSSINNEENIKEENVILFFEINQLKKDINLYQSRLDELTSEYNKLRQEYQEILQKNFSFDELDKEKQIEEEYIKLEEEKYNIILKKVRNQNNLLKLRNEKVKRHNEQMKKFYKLYTGEEWGKSNKNI